MRICLKAGGYEQHAALFQKTVEKKMAVQLAEDGLTVAFAIDPALGKAESYRISGSDNTWKITGADALGLYFGIGKFLHTAIWRDGAFKPDPPEGVKTPACSFRAMYFPFHHYQWYHVAPVEELEEYVEDMLLWGYNAIVCCLPVINVSDFSGSKYREGMDKVKRVFQAAKRFGMQVGVICTPNAANQSMPAEFANDGSFNLLMRNNHGKNVCPSKPGAMDYLRSVWRESIFVYLADVGLDCVILWPYDEGGCGCDLCRPWGGNGYLRTCTAFKDEALKYFPNIKFIVSTWAFDDPDDEGEYEGLYAHLQDSMAWADYLMIDSHGDFPRYPLEHESCKPIVNFPEISMWGLYPWGGFGATALPKRFQRIWDQAKHLLQGGMPYSEGIYEDILKIQWAGYYWEPDRHYRDILAEYISYEYSDTVIPEVLEIMEGIEDNHVAVAELREPDLSKAIRVHTLAEQVNARLSKQIQDGWKWRLLYIRTVLDKKRYEYYVSHGMHGADELARLRDFSGEFLTDDPQAQALFRELIDRYHMDMKNMNWATLPPLGGVTVAVGPVQESCVEKIAEE